MPDTWWTRQPEKLYMQPVQKHNLEEYIKSNKFMTYNKDPKAPVHVMQAKWPVLEVLGGLSVIILLFNVTRKLKVMVINEETVKLFNQYVQEEQ